MLLRIVSDLHLEHDYQELPIMDNEDTQTLILAGDITPNIKQYEEFLLDVSYRFKHIIIIYGNHEYYGHEIESHKDAMTDMCSQFSNVRILDNHAINVDGITIYGGTLWTNGYKDVSSSLNDFNVVKYIDEYGNNGYYEDYLDCIGHIQTMIIEFDVIITHHAPSYKSVAPMFENSKMNKYFMNHLDELIRNSGEKLKLWIHGHVHNSNNYKIGNTDIISNPKGYYQENKEYNNELIYKI